LDPKTRPVSLYGAGFVVGVTVDPAVAESAPRPGVVEAVEATCVCEVDLDSSKAPKNLFVTEPSLSVQGTDGICGRSCDPFGSTFASGIILPGSTARKTLFIPPSSPL
jgi:hypothetical protein